MLPDTPESKATKETISYDPYDTRDSYADTTLYRTVDIFAGIVGRRIQLKNSAQTRTDGFVIEAPLYSEDVYSRVEHELAHIVFRSDPRAKKAFLSKYTAAISKLCAIAGKPLKQPAQLQLAVQLDVLLDILEDQRVNSLWGLLYPGSYAAIKAVEHREVKAAVPNPNKNVLTYFAYLYCTGSVPSGPFERFRPLMEEALSRVTRRGFSATLATGRWLMVQLVSELLREEPLPLKKSDNGSGEDALELSSQKQTDSGGSAGLDSAENTSSEPWEPDPVEASPEERAGALGAIIEKLGELPQALREHLGDSQVPDFTSPAEEQRASSVATAALASDPTSAELLAALTKEASGVVGEVEEALRKPLSVEQRIKQDVNAKVIFHDVTEVNAQILSPPSLTAEDVATVERLRALFLRVMGKTKNALEESGSEVDVPALIERRMTGEPIPVFRHIETGQGFRALLLIDKSKSMDEEDDRLKKAFRAARIIRKALDFPFVTTEVWGFTCIGDGQVDITRYRNNDIFDVPETAKYGVTPIPAAVQTARVHLQGGTDIRQLFLITDGNPVYCRKDGSVVPMEARMDRTAKEVKEARLAGINVTTLMIGDEVEPEDMEKMYGSPRYWRQVTNESFHRDLLAVVSSSFVSYLRKR